MSIGENIKRIRISKKLTQSELGKRMGVSQPAIGQFEHAHHLKFSTIKKIAAALDVPAGEIIDDLAAFLTKKDGLNVPVGKNIKHFRTKLKLSQQELAEIAGISAEIMSRYEDGELIPSFKNLKKLAVHLDTTTAVLMGQESDSEDTPKTIAAYNDSGYGDLTEEEKEDVRNYIKFIKSNRKK